MVKVKYKHICFGNNDTYHQFSSIKNIPVLFYCQLFIFGCFYVTCNPRPVVVSSVFGCTFRSRLQEAQSAQSAVAGIRCHPFHTAAAKHFYLGPAGGISGCSGCSAGQGALQPGQAGGPVGRSACPPSAAHPGLLQHKTRLFKYNKTLLLYNYWKSKSVDISLPPSTVKTCFLPYFVDCWYLI